MDYIKKRKKFPKQMTIKMENQRDWVHLVTDYYPGENLMDHICSKVNFKEHELVNIIRGILSAITYCHMNLRLIIGNLNPESIVCDFRTKYYHTRVVNFNHIIMGACTYVRQRIHKLNLQRTTGVKDNSPVTFAAMFLAPE